MHYGRGYTSGCVGASGNFFVIGGSHVATCPPGMECYDFIAQKWRIFGNTPIPPMAVADADVAPIHQMDILIDDDDDDNDGHIGEQDDDDDEEENEMDFIGLEINDDDGNGGDGMDGIEAPFADGIPVESLRRASHQVQYLL